MIRKVCAFGLLLLLVTAGYSIAAKPDKPTKEEQKSKQDKAAKQDNREKKARGSKRVAGAKGGSTYNGYVCLEQLWQDYPGDDDLYAAAYYGNGCENEPTWELWYGTPNPDLEMPQTCDLCEGGYGGPQSTRGANVPPHKLKLDKENSWRMLRAGLEAADISTGAMSPEYYTIPKASLPAGMQAANPNGIDIVGVELPPPPKSHNSLYLCLQTRTLPSGTTTSPPFTVQQRPGAQLYIEFDVGTNHYKGLVWLRNKPN